MFSKNIVFTFDKNNENKNHLNQKIMTKKTLPTWVAFFFLIIGFGAGISIGVALNSYVTNKDADHVEPSSGYVITTRAGEWAGTDSRLDNLEVKVWMLENPPLYSVGDSIVLEVQVYFNGKKNKPEGVIVKVENEYPYTWRYTVFDGVDLFGVKEENIISLNKE